MSTLEDKILGEKATNYCSSSEDEDELEIEEGDGSAGVAKVSSDVSNYNKGGPFPDEGKQWQGYSRNTGPKGVLRDWQLFKEHEEQMRVVKEQQLLTMINENALTCLTEADEKNIKAEEKLAAGEIDEDDLLSDEVFQDFLKKRMEAMLKSQNTMLEFGELYEITSGESYLKILDETNEKVTIIIHIYETRSPACIRMNECLSSLTGIHRNVRFCKIKAAVAGVSNLFQKEGVPALLVYKGGNLIGNFVRLIEDFGSEFYPGDVENYLIENGVLQDQGSISNLMKEKCNFNS